MSQIVLLMRENPVGTVFIILAALITLERCCASFFKRNRPEMKCDCECCDALNEDDDFEED